MILVRPDTFVVVSIGSREQSLAGLVACGDVFLFSWLLYAELRNGLVVICRRPHHIRFDVFFY